MLFGYGTEQIHREIIGAAAILAKAKKEKLCTSDIDFVLNLLDKMDRIVKLYRIQ